jgi:hypothetical protein
MRVHPDDGEEVDEVEEVAALEPELVHAASVSATASTSERRSFSLTDGRV